jgi:hypothetical protein
MATLTTAVYLDDAARTAGEAMTNNGGSLTIRTDTRWHANSPASMTGSLGSHTISATLGGSYIIDGRNVRWLAITGGSGSAAIGTTVSQGGVSGYFLGYWASLTSAPSTTIGATGFIKLREVTGGTFSAGALSGITATAAGADVVGWIEVVHDQAATITVPRLGDFTTRGDWFELGTTTGASNQLVQVPTNGSATAYVPAVWIETSPGSGTYDKYPAIYAALMITTNLGTDVRSKFVCMGTNGQVRIGHNGTTAVGYVPASGCKIRIPNILGRQCATATRATNAIPHTTITSWPEFLTTSAGIIDVENFMGDWYFYLLQAAQARFHHVAVFEAFNLQEIAQPLDLDDCVVGHSQSRDIFALNLTSCFAGGTISNSKIMRASTGSNDHCIAVSYCDGTTFDNVEAGIITFARSSGVSFQNTQSYNITYNNCRSHNHGIQFTTSFNCVVNDHDHTDRYVGATTTAGVYAFYALASCDGITLDGMTFGYNGTIANVHPYLGVAQVGQSKNIKIRNLGSRSAFLSGGSANNPAVIVASAGNNNNIKVQRCYMTPTRTAAVSLLNSDRNMTYEHVYGDYADAQVVAALNATIRNCGCTTSATGQASVYGTHFYDMWASDTAGRIQLVMNEPTTETAAYVTTVSGTPKFTSAGNVSMTTVGDEIIWEQHYFALGITDTPTTAPVITGTNVTYSSGARWGNHDIYFQYDIGSGWNGSWLDLTGANFGAIGAVDPAVGLKVKIRAVCAVAATNNLMTHILLYTTSTLAAQTDNLYPLDQITLTLTGLVSGSDVTILSAGTETVLNTTEDWAGTTYPYTYETPGSIDVAIYKPGYIPFFIRGYSAGSSNASLPCAQVADPSYLT